MKNIFYSSILVILLSLAMSPVLAQSSFSDFRILQNQKETTISMYPLPTEGILHIAFNKSITESPSILVYDIIGNLVENVTVDRENASAFTINLSGRKAGFYFVKIQTNTESFSRRITVKP
jgi:Secretion system C-terminal sorting domain